MIHDSIQTLFARCIRSSTALETLLLLHRSRNTYWTTVAAATALGAPVEPVAEAMAELERAGLLERATATTAFRYAPAGDATGVDALAAAWNADRHAVMEAMRQGQ